MNYHIKNIATERKGINFKDIFWIFSIIDHNFESTSLMENNFKEKFVKLIFYWISRVFGPGLF